MRVNVEGTVQGVVAWDTGTGTDVFVLQNSKGAPSIARITWGSRTKQPIPKQGEKANIQARVFLSKQGGLLCFAE